MVELGKVAKVISGATPKRNVPKYWGGNINWVTPKDLSGLKTKYFDIIPEGITEEGLKSCSTTLLPPNSVLLSSRAPIGLLAITKFDLCTNQGFKSIVPSPKLDSSFLYYFLKTNVRKLNHLGRGATFKEISKGTVESLKIPLPPLPIQKEIASVLDKASAVCRHTAGQLAELDKLEEAVFLEMFGDPVRNERGWEKKELGSLSLKFSDGPFGSNLKTSHYMEEGIRVIRLTNIGVGEFVDINKAYISKDHYENVLKKHTCVEGDVLFATLGEPNLRACLFPKKIPIAVNKADCLQFKPNLKKINPSYLVHLINAHGTQALVKNMIHGQTRGRISKGQLTSFKIPVPPLPLQTQFATVIENIELQKAALRASMRESEDLFGGLLQGVF